jgi:hypothetical protein
VALRTVVYLGPSLPRHEAEGILEAEYRPPVRRGDLPSLPPEVDLVGIIDGVFMSEAAVGHREILALLERGTRVIGGGSMGALRASELHDFGMQGVGEIFELYASGQIEGDDEVALTFHPETLEPLSEPLVNMRLNLRRAVEEGVVDGDDASSVLERVAREYFPRRSLLLMMRSIEDVLDDARSASLRDFLRRDYVDFKRADAVKVLTALRTAREEIESS